MKSSCNKKHTIADLYRDTTEAERVELIDGQYYNMPMVNTLHQQFMSEISSQIYEGILACGIKRLCDDYVPGGK